MEANTTPLRQAPAANSQVLGINIPALPPTPFVGLRPFNSNEPLLFFGRSEQTVELLQQLHRTRFLAVVGSSGCGKSSLIYAGLLPKLKAGFLVEDRDHWLIATMKPGDRPLRNLVAALLAAVAAAPNPKAVEAFADEMRVGRTQAVIERLTPTLAASDANLLLLVDQFEETFRFGLASGNPAQREDVADFVSILLALIQQCALPIYVVMTMRSDFLGECDNFYGLPEAMNHSQYLVPRLTRQQRQQAIEGPIRLFGQRITTRLLDRVLNDVGEQSDQLPVMQHALMRTWEQWTQSPDLALDVPHYEAIGTIKDALSLDANRALAEMSAEARKITKRMFQALTDTDTRNRRVRRPMHLSGLRAITGASHEQSIEIIEHFRSSGRAFLTVTADPDPLIDISHESLIRQWRTLKTWVAAEAESARQYQRLEDAAKRHQRRGAELWRGVDLEYARMWKEQEKPTAAWAARYGDAYQLAMDFLQASEAAEDKQRHEQEQAHQRELEQARELADVQTRAASRLKVIAGVIGVLLLITISLTIYAFDAKNKAKQQARLATSHQLVAHARSPSMRLDLALLSSLAASHIIDTVATRGSILDGLLRSPRLLTFLTGHTNTIASVIFSPDGKTLASGSVDNTIRLWDVANRQPLGAPLSGHTEAIASVTFSPDGKTLASSSADNTIRLWDVANRHALGAPLTGHTKIVTSVTFSPDGKTLASSSADNTIRLWDVANRQPLGAPLSGHTDAVWSVTFSPDGKTLASSSADNTIRLWDVANRQPLGAPLSGHTNTIASVTFSPDGKSLASGSVDNTIRLWDVANRQPLGAPLSGHTDAVWSVTFSPDGKTLASGSADNTIVLWDVANRQPLGAPLSGHTNTIASVTFSPNGKSLASGSADNTIVLWDVANRQPLGAPLSGHTHIVTSVTFSPNGKSLASGSVDNTIRLWDVANRQPLGAPLSGHTHIVTSVTFSPDGKTLASSSVDNTIRLWDVANRQPLGVPLSGHTKIVTSVTFSPDGKTLASGSVDKTIRLWDVANRQPLGAPLSGHTEAIASVTFSPDGKTLASSSVDKTIRLWDVANRQPLGAPLSGHTEAIASVTFSPDGKTLASSSADKTIRLWNVANRQPLGAPLSGHTKIVTSVTFSPDGKALASGSVDKTIRLWDVANRQPLGAPLSDHTHIVTSVTFSPDGKTLASGSWDNTIRLWDVSFGSWKDRACRIANHNLTPEEWKQYIGDIEPYRAMCPGLPIVMEAVSKSKANVQP